MSVSQVFAKNPCTFSKIKLNKQNCTDSSNNSHDQPKTKQHAANQSESQVYNLHYVY